MLSVVCPWVVFGGVVDDCVDVVFVAVSVAVVADAGVVVVADVVVVCVGIFGVVVVVFVVGVGLRVVLDTGAATLCPHF